MNRKLRKHADLLILAACYLAPLFTSWSFSPILTALLGILILGEFFALVYIEDPTGATWFPSITVFILCSKAFVLSMMALPGWPSWNLTSLLCYLTYMLVAVFVVRDACQRVSQVATRCELEATPAKIKAIHADLSVGNIDETEATSKRERVLHDALFCQKLDGLGWCLRYETAGTFFTLLVLGITDPVTILGHLLLTVVVAINLGLLVTRSSTDSNLS